MGGAWPLVGRLEELAYARAAVADPSTAGLVLAGVAGVGKTRLAREAVVAAQHEVGATEWVVATRSAASIPFGAFAHLLPTREALAMNRLALLQWAAEALRDRAADGRLVLVVDDAHLLDDASAALVHHVAAAGSAFVIATTRTGEPAPDPIVSLWKDGLATRFDVQPLAKAEVASLLAAALGGHVEGATLHRLWESTGGNPLYLREMVQHGREAGVLTVTRDVWRWHGRLTAGDRLAEILETRLGGLDAGARRVVELVALGEPVGATLLGAMTESRAVEEMERRGVIAASHDDRRFYYRAAHPLYTEVIRRRLPLSAARGLQRELADALEGSGARRRDDLMRVASWRLDAGSVASPETLVAGAVRARVVFDHGLSERLARAAVEAGGGTPARLALAEALYWTGRHEESVAALAELNHDTMSDAERSEAAIKLAGPLFWGLGRVEEAEAALTQAEHAIDDVAWRAEVIAQRASVCLFNGRPAEAIEIASAVLDDPASGDRAAIRAVAQIVPAWAITGECDRAMRAAIEAIPLALRMADQFPHALGELVVSQALVHWLAGRLDEAEAVASSLYDIAVAQHADDARGLWAFALGRCAVARGQPRTAIRWLQESVAVLRHDDIGRFLPWSMGVLANALAIAGEPSAAEAALAEAEQVGVAEVKLFRVDVSLARVWIASARGETSTACRFALGAADEAAAVRQRVPEIMALHDVARLGRPRDVAARLAALAPHVDGVFAPAAAAHVAALAADDAPALEACAEQFDSIGAYLLAAEAAGAAAAAYRASGFTNRATSALARAHVAAERCEGARTPGLALLSRASPVASLTAREREVAALAASGLTNREIAEKLVVSVRTIDNHLARSFSKLGVNAREQLASLLGT